MSLLSKFGRLNACRSVTNKLLQTSPEAYFSTVPSHVQGPITSIDEVLDKHQTPPHIKEIIHNENLLSLGALNKLDTLYPQYSNIRGSEHQMFKPEMKYLGIAGFRAIIDILGENGIILDNLEERELFINSYRFLATGHILNQVDWKNPHKCSIFHLFFPQKGMLPSKVEEAYLAAKSPEEKQKIALDHIKNTNPHDGNQLLNKPWFKNNSGGLEVVEGCQHKYPQCNLIFDKEAQDCFSFCSYCFRHAQVRGDEDMFIQEDPAQMVEYLKRHPEITDMLLTGGDAGYLTESRLREYVDPVMKDPALNHITTVRIGSRALTYYPQVLFSDNRIQLFREMRDNGIQPAWMGHFSSPRELLNPLTLAAINRLLNAKTNIKSQSPIMKHISAFVDEKGEIDVEKSADNWITLAHILSRTGIGWHSMYCPRPTGEVDYFTFPLEKISEIFNLTYRSLSSLARPSRHLSMTISAGKVCIRGKAVVNGEEVFALQFSEARNMEWMDKTFLAKVDKTANNVGLLKPFDSDKFFFVDELEEIEKHLNDKIVAAKKDI